MKFLRFAAFITLLFSSPVLFSQTDEKWNLEKCIDYALKNNIQVRQAGVLSQISANDHLQSKLNLLPSIEGTANFTDNFGIGVNLQTYTFATGNSQSAQVNLQGTLPVFTGLQQMFNIDRARYELLATKFDYENSQRNVALSVASAYLQILLDKEILGVAEKQQQLTETQKQTVQAKIKTGALPETSGYDVESQLARDKANVVNAQNAVSLSLLALRQLLQISDEKFDVEVPEINLSGVDEVASISAQSVYEYALADQPSIKSAEAHVNSANASRKMAIGALSPTISVFGGISSGYFSQDRNYSVTYDTIFGYAVPTQNDLGKKTLSQSLHDNFRQVVGINLDVPLFSKWQRVTNIQDAKLQLQIRQLQLEGAKNQLRQDIEQAYTNATTAAQSYAANKESLDAANVSYNAAEKRYNAGMLGTFEFQQSKNTLAVAESEMVKAKYTYIFRLKVLDFYQGKPLKLEE